MLAGNSLPIMERHKINTQPKKYCLLHPSLSYLFMSAFRLTNKIGVNINTLLVGFGTCILCACSIRVLVDIGIG